jgi:hypothetical protein
MPSGTIRARIVQDIKKGRMIYESHHLRFGVAIVGFACLAAASVFGAPLTDFVVAVRAGSLDVTIDNIRTSANQFDVTESVLTIERGPYSLALRDPEGPPTDRQRGRVRW